MVSCHLSDQRGESKRCLSRGRVFQTNSTAVLSLSLLGRKSWSIEKKKKKKARATKLVEKEKEMRLERQVEVRLFTAFEAILRTLVFSKVKNQREQRDFVKF